MGKLAEVFLGILTAMGGFVEIGELTFTLNAGQALRATRCSGSSCSAPSASWCIARWPVALLRCGSQAVFSLIRERDGFSAGLLTLVAASSSTC